MEWTDKQTAIYSFLDQKHCTVSFQSNLTHVHIIPESSSEDSPQIIAEIQQLPTDLEANFSFLSVTRG